MTRDEHRALLCEMMAHANHQAFDRLSERQKQRLRATAASYLDSLHGIARVVPGEATEEMHAAADKEWDGRMSARAAGVFEAMSSAGDLTNHPEKKKP